jgi:hypothetical protein
MTPAADLWAHLQTALLLGWLVSLPAGRRRASVRWLPLPALAAAWLPLGDLDLSAWVYAYSGPLAVPSWVLLGAGLLHRTGLAPRLPGAERTALLGMVAVLALLLYPLALGLGPYDPYGLGFAGPGLPLAVAAGALLAWWQQRPGVALTVLVALAAWTLGLGESHNLWDYLLDAWLGLAAWGWFLLRWVRYLLTKI